MASYGSSVPTSVGSPASSISDQIAQLAAALGVQVFNWAQSTYQQTSQITDQSISNFLATSQIGLQAAQQQLSQYENVTVPEINQLASEAAEYSSPARVSQNMGAAESDASQTADAARMNAIQNLESYGVDPSSGMYANLERAANTQAGAAEAGAGEQARINTENTGRQLLQQSILEGQQLPGDVVNSLNSAYQGISGAENSALSRASVGAQVEGAAAPYFNAAMSLRNPPTGNVSRTGNNTPSSVRDPNANKNKNNNNQQPQYQDIPSNFGAIAPAYVGTPKGAKMIGMQGVPSEGGPTVQAAQDPAFDWQGPSQNPDIDESGSGFVDPSGVGGPLAQDPFNQSWQDAGQPNNGQNPITQTQGTPFNNNNYGTNVSDNQAFNSPGAQTFTGEDANQWMQPDFSNPTSGEFGDMSNTQQGAQQAGQTNSNNAPDIWGQLSPTGVDPNSNSTFSPGGAQFGGQNYWGPGFNQSNGPGFDSAGAGSGLGDPQSWGIGNFNGSGGFGGDTFNGDWNSGGGANFDTNNFGAVDQPTSSWINSSNQGGGNWQDSSFNNWQDPFNSQMGGDNFSFNQSPSGQFYDPYSAGWQPSSADQGGNWGNQWDGSQWGGGDYGGGGDGGGYARGGRVGARSQQRGVMPTPGGRVPMRASPSQGQRTDDVKANLTSGEFVVPKDVVAFKGAEFFHKLIAQARKARVTHGAQQNQQRPGPSTPVGGQPSRPLPGPARFNSRPMSSAQQRPQMGR